MSKFKEILKGFVYGLSIIGLLLLNIMLIIMIMMQFSITQPIEIQESAQEIPTVISPKCFDSDGLYNNFLIPMKAEVITSFLTNNGLIITVWANEDTVFVYTLDKDKISCYLSHGERIQ